MANTKEIKNHISSVRDTQKITNAMYLIASTKMQKARAELEQTRPYFAALRTEIKRVFRKAGDIESKYFYPVDVKEKLEGTYGCLVITADKGLAGAYNQNVIKEAEKLRAQHEDIKFYVVGEYGRQYFAQHRIPIERSFLYTAQNPTMQRARDISAILLNEFTEGNLDKIFVIYTDWKNRISEETVSTRLLPFHREQFKTTTEEAAIHSPFGFYPSVEKVLDVLMPSYVSGFIYSALVDSFCSEQNARMTAMSAANDNAEKLLSSLSVEYNRVRQAGVTQEITEVSAGAKAQKKKNR